MSTSTKEGRLTELGLALPAPLQLPPRVGLPFPWVRIVGTRAVFSGHGPTHTDESLAQPLGKVGLDVSEEQADVAARPTGMAVLESLKRELGSLSRIACWSRMFGRVNSAPGFTRQLAVINGFADLIISVFGPHRTRGTRAQRGGLGGVTLPYPGRDRRRGRVAADRCLSLFISTHFPAWHLKAGLRGADGSRRSRPFHSPSGEECRSLDPCVKAPLAECERIPRTLPLWFGHEQSLLEYAQDAGQSHILRHAAWPRGRFRSAARALPASVRKFHCIAVEADHTGHGSGRGLQPAAEDWLVNRGVRLLQVKSLAASFPSEEYAQTREFCRAAGYLPLEVFAELREAGVPVLLLVKVLASAA